MRKGGRDLFICKAINSKSMIPQLAIVCPELSGQCWMQYSPHGELHSDDVYRSVRCH